MQTVRRRLFAIHVVRFNNIATSRRRVQETHTRLRGCVLLQRIDHWQIDPLSRGERCEQNDII